MNNQIKKAVKLLFATVIIITIVCSSNSSLTGGTSIPNQIAGIIYTPAGKPANNARVKLMSDSTKDYRPDHIFDSTLSDAQGKYLFVNVPAGNYSIVATAQDSMFVVQHNGIIVPDNGNTVHTADTMLHGGVISGTVKFDGADSNLYVQLLKTHYSAIFDDAGNFKFTPVPSGNYTLLTLFKHGYRDQPVLIRVDSIRVSTGSETVIDTITTVPLYATAGLRTFDDFEDSNSINTLGCSWWTFNDANNGGYSSITPSLGTDFTQAIDTNGVNASAFCCHIKYHTGQTPICFAGMGCELAPYSNGIMQSRDLSRLKRMNLWLKGKGSLSIELISGIANAENVTLLAVGSCPGLWTKFSVDIDSLLASGNTQFRNNWEKTKQSIVQFDIIGTGAGGSDGEFWTDDIEFEFR